MREIFISYYGEDPLLYFGGNYYEEDYYVGYHRYDRCWRY